MLEEVHAYRHTYMQTYISINIKSTCRRGTGDAEVRPFFKAVHPHRT